jgi:hypothetical protein
MTMMMMKKHWKPAMMSFDETKTKMKLNYRRIMYKVAEARTMMMMMTLMTSLTKKMKMKMLRITMVNLMVATLMVATLLEPMMVEKLSEATSGEKTK